jgi:outer membrane immunogenic protein
MKRVTILAAAAMGVALTQSALAADLGVRPAPPVYAPPVAIAPTWTGVYIGFNGGWGWSNSNNNTLTVGPTLPPGAFGVFTPATFGGIGGNDNNNKNGPVFGGQLGYNYQAGNWVFGVEGDVDGTNIRNNQSGAITLAPVGVVGSGFLNVKQEWLASIRGRLGYTWGPGMIYVTGGGAWTGVKADGSATVASTIPGGTFLETGTFDQSKTLSGWVVGAGYEWMIAPNWALRGEYLYYGFTGNNNNNSGTLVFPVSGVAVAGNTGKLNTSVVRIGLDYKFDWLRY